MPFSFRVRWRDDTREPEIFTEDEKWTVDGDDIVFTLTQPSGEKKVERIAMEEVEGIDPWPSPPAGGKQTS